MLCQLCSCNAHGVTHCITDTVAASTAGLCACVVNILISWEPNVLQAEVKDIWHVAGCNAPACNCRPYDLLTMRTITRPQAQHRSRKKPSQTLTCPLARALKRKIKEKKLTRLVCDLAEHVGSITICCLGGSSTSSQSSNTCQHAHGSTTALQVQDAQKMRN